VQCAWCKQLKQKTGETIQIVKTLLAARMQFEQKQVTKKTFSALSFKHSHRNTKINFSGKTVRCVRIDRNEMKQTRKN